MKRIKTRIFFFKREKHTHRFKFTKTKKEGFIVLHAEKNQPTGVVAFNIVDDDANNNEDDDNGEVTSTFSLFLFLVVVFVV